MKNVLRPAFTLARTSIACLALFLHLNSLSSAVAQVRIGDKSISATDPIPAMNPNSLLELESSSRGLLLPRLTTAQINAMPNVPAGMLVYNTTDNLLNVKINSGWVPLVKAANSAAGINPWSMKGSTTYVMNGNVGIGLDTPSEALHVNGNIKYSGTIQMGLQYIAEEYTVISNSAGSRTVGCPTATKLIGGGGGQLDPNNTLVNSSITYNGPDTADANAWRVSCSNRNEAVVAVRVYAICAKVQ